MALAARCRTVWAASCLLLCPLPAAAALTSTAFDRGAILAAARALPARGELRLAAVPWAVDGASGSVSLRLERFEVFAPDARIVLHTGGADRLLPVPANVYLRGRVEDDPQSRVVLSVLETGEIRGLATSRGRTWSIGSAVAGGLLEVREVDSALDLAEAGGGFRCDLDDLGTEAFRSTPGEGEVDLAASPDPSASAPATDAPFVFDHTAVIAIETDNEFLNLAAFGSDPAPAVNYIADLIAYSSTIYVDELQTAWSLGYISLWGPGAADPWVQTSPSCGLIDFGRYWNNNRSSVTRTVTHFLSGKSTNAGIAWVGVLCSGAFSIDAAQVATGCSPPLTGTSNWGGGYGYTSGIDGNFNINSPSVVWDIQAFTHEIGHNFNSPHTHCYQNVGGNAAPVDKCYAGQCGTANCFCATAGDPAALPAGCPNGTSGCGTIMSYCHLPPWSSANISLTLGLGHPYGVMPERVPNRMRSHVVSTAAGNPSCLALRQPLVVLFADGFHSHNTSAWSATVP